MYKQLHRITRIPEKYEKIRNINLKTLDIITVLMKNDRVREFVGLDTRSPEEVRYNNRNATKPSFPKDYEIPKEPRMQVKKIENKEDYIDLLLEADPSKDMIHKYLNDSDVYALKKEDELISIAVILPISRKTLELKNIVTRENYRNKGYAKTLLKSLCGNYKQKYNRMLVGTTENNIPFYVKQGFDKYEKTIKNFFADNYKEEIKDGDLVCTDLIYYSKDLKKKVKDN